MVGQGPPYDPAAKRKRAEARFPWITGDAVDQYLLIVPSTSSAHALMPPVML